MYNNKAIPVWFTAETGKLHLQYRYRTKGSSFGENKAQRNPMREGVVNKSLLKPPVRVFSFLGDSNPHQFPPLGPRAPATMCSTIKRLAHAQGHRSAT